MSASDLIRLPDSTNMPYVVLALLAGLMLTTLLREAYRTNFPRIRGIPEVPNALPFVGHLLSLGGRMGLNDSSVFSRWSSRLQSPIFQCVLGNQRAIVVSDWAIMKCMWVEQSHSLSDRPHQPGFVDKLGIDLTGFPMTEQVRKCRAAGMRALSKSNWPKYYHLLESSSERFLGWLQESSEDGRVAIDTYAWLRHIVFHLTLSLTYGSRLGEVDDNFMLSFIKSINDISAVRSSTKTFRHFVPLLRLRPEAMSKTMEAERVRRRHRDVLYNRYRDRVAMGEQVDCIVAALDQDKLSEEEVHGTCLSLLQAAPDTVASGVYQTVAWLSSPEGQATQHQAYLAIMEAYDGDRDKAWKEAFRAERVPLISSLNKETLRFFTFAPYATPRRTTVETVLPGGVVIPKGITVIMNAQQINHDEDHFGKDAWTYKPNRYIGTEAGLPHVAFGAGVRICPAVAISNRIIYALLTRMILAFEMRGSQADGRRPSTHPIQFSDVHDQLVAQPKRYDCHFYVRDSPWLERLLTRKPESDPPA